MLFVPWRMPKAGRVYEERLDDASLKFGLPKNLLARVAYQESRFRPEIIDGTISSSAGAKGIMQIVPRWHPDVDPLNPDEAIPYAAEYLKRLFNRFGSWSDALVAYNWGQGNLSRWQKGELLTMPKETRDYVSEIMKDVFRF